MADNLPADQVAGRVFKSRIVDINAKDNVGRTPVDQMLQNGRKDLAEVLHRHGGDSA